ncbi:MAG: PIN domain-containing protein [Candidatus Diapherotrites archaeon]
MQPIALIADTNALLSALLKDNLSRKIFLNPKVKLSSPQHMNEEVNRHAEELAKRIGITQKEFVHAFELLLEKSGLEIIAEKQYESLKPMALELCPEGHKDDWPFLALALKQNCALWSNDKALKKQSTIEVHSTFELKQKLGKLL